MNGIFARPLALLPSLGAVAAAAASATAPDGATPLRPNIVCIFADDHSFQTISAYGHPISRLAPTPNIDRLAQRGMIFRESFVENSISAPSRATLLTGKYSHQHNQRTLAAGLDSSITWFPEILRDNGYHTALIGKLHLFAEPKGFDYFSILQDQGEYYNPRFRSSDSEGEYVREAGYATNLITDKAIEWLDRNTADGKPFCILVNHKAPHRDWMPDFPYMNLYEDVTFPEPPTLFDNYETRGPQMKQQELTIDRHMGYAFDFKVRQLADEPTLPYIRQSWINAMSELTPEEKRRWEAAYDAKNAAFLASRPQGRELLKWKYQRYIKEYCRTIKSIDDQVGRLVDYLDEHGLTENTIIVYTSDQGFLMGEHGLYDKRFMYEESLRTPLIVSWPGHIASGSECDEMVQNIDLAPTFLNVAGCSPDSEMAGSPLIELFATGKSDSWRKDIYYHYYDYPAVGSVWRHDGVRNGRFKLIHWYGEGYNGDSDIDYYEFYDLEKDPTEVSNCIDDPKYKVEIKSLKNRLGEYRSSLKVDE